MIAADTTWPEAFTIVSLTLGFFWFMAKVIKP